MLLRIFIVFIIVLLASCSSETSNTNLAIENSEYDTLLVQEVKNNTSSSDMKKTINDKNLVEGIISAIEDENIELKKNDENVELEYKMKTENYYQILMSEGDYVNTSNAFTLIIFEDGTVITSEPNESTELSFSYISTDKHSKLLDDLEDLLSSS